jgi:hypothetical protein
MHSIVDGWLLQAVKLIEKLRGMHSLSRSAFDPSSIVFARRQNSAFRDEDGRRILRSGGR